MKMGGKWEREVNERGRLVGERDKQEVEVNEKGRK